MQKRDAALEKAIQRAGGVNELARKLGITKQAVSAWRRVPIKHLAFLAQFAPRKALRPDLYGAAPAHKQ